MADTPEQDKAEEADGKLLVAGCDSTVFLEMTDEALDA
jgi:hypothetical protein